MPSDKDTIVMIPRKVGIDAQFSDLSPVVQSLIDLALDDVFREEADKRFFGMLPKGMSDPTP